MESAGLLVNPCLKSTKGRLKIGFQTTFLLYNPIILTNPPKKP
ncbi:hypothetical protein NEIMUCOT_03583 [Neisseria mucosa ATCC 25996]|uniref:Uncharacterized protein n=1 Tax=Neisseria mucosa (strain ATCC 25996 / DSM 4631 / NCTC 10774 / M26) TaxID=546266 RepID=D2ZSK1_NEIM2|nr:hypothetical protein NEIMUCOT_03583 [Neisseria mucosa ATCC 25996]